MADLNYDVSVNTSQAERNLTNLQKSIGGVNDSFVKFRNTLATISFGAVIAQAVKFADSVQDLADATDLSTASIIGFGKAVAQNGGSVEGAQKGIAKLIAEIDDAANTAGASREAFNDVGVSLDDLRTKSTQDIFNQVIKGLAGIDDSATKSKLAAILLNKEMKGVNFKGVGADFGSSTASAQEYSSSIKAAAEANDKLAAAVGTFQLKLLAALEPINKFIGSIDPKTIEIFADRIISLGTALAGLYVVGKIAALIEGYIVVSRAAAGATLAMVAAGGGMTGMFAMAGLGLKQMGQAFNISTAATVAAHTGFSILGISVKSFFSGFLRLIPLIGTAILVFQVLDGVLEALTGKDVWEWAQQAAKGIGLIKQTSGEKAAADKKAADDHLANLKEIDAENEKIRKEIIRGQEAVKKVKDSYAKVNLETAQYIDNLSIGLSRQTEAIAFEARMIELSKLKNKISEDDVEIFKAQSEAQIQGLAKLKELEQQRERLRLQQSQSKDADEQKILGGQITGIGKQIDKTKEFYAVHDESLAYHITNLQTVRKLDAARVQDMENMKTAIEDQITRQQSLSDILVGINKEKSRAVQAPTTAETTGMTSIEKKILEIQTSAKNAASDAAAAFAAQFNNEEGGLTPERAQELTDGLNQIADAYKGLSDAQTEIATKNYVTSRSFATGWKDAFAAFVEDAGNSAKIAGDLFNSITSKMTSAIDTFVETGKFSFGDLASSIIKDLIKIELKASAMAMFGAGKTALAGAGGIGGLLSGIGSFFGFANGGATDGNNPIMVGERGPELFVPRSAGTIIPNNQLGQQQIVNNNQFITNNVSAIDAKGVAQLFYENRQTLFGTVEQAKKELPFRGAMA